MRAERLGVPRDRVGFDAIDAFEACGRSLESRRAPIDSWGVGTMLVLVTTDIRARYRAMSPRLVDVRSRMQSPAQSFAIEFVVVHGAAPWCLELTRCGRVDEHWRDDRGVRCRSR